MNDERRRQPSGNQAGRRHRARAALARGMGGSRTAVRRVHAWTRTPLGRAVIVIAGLLILFVIVFALIGIPLIFRGTPIHTVRAIPDNVPPANDSFAFLLAAQTATGTELESGTTVEVLVNGNGFFPRLWQDLRSARHTITVVNYYAADGALADSLGLILGEKARSGVRVFFVYDPIGSLTLSDEWFERLRRSGARVAEFRPLRWYRLDRANHRTHVRGIVIDGSVAFTGGYGFDDRWVGNGRSADQWRETNVRLTGPPVAALQAMFLAHWAEAAGELLVGSLLTGAMDPASAQALGPSDDSHRAEFVGILYSTAGFGSSNAERALAFSLATARRTLNIANSYFVPDEDFVRLLCDAKRRGVDVRVLTNSDKSDVPIVWLAGRNRYRHLLACGVRIFEYQPTVLHSKTLVADGAWTLIGTINFDNRSLAFNEEVSLLAFDQRIGALMDSLFRADLEYAVEIEAEAFAGRGVWQKLRERAADLVSRWL